MSLLLILAAAAASAPPSAAAPAQTIVVTGTRLSDSEKALRECLARHCPLPGILPEGDEAKWEADPSFALPEMRLKTGNAYFEKNWVDVGFWVTSEGKVTEPEVLRGEGAHEWTKPLLRSIAGRIYTPSVDPDGSYRIERYTMTSRFMESVSGSHMRQRSPNMRLEFLDLTNDPAAAAPPTSPGPSGAAPAPSPAR